MEQAGLEFVLKGLNDFITGNTKAQRSVENLGRALDLAGTAVGGSSGLGNTLIQLGIIISSIAPEIGPVIAVLGVLVDMFQGMADKIGGVVGGAIKGFISLVKTLATALDSIIRPITNFIGGILNAINPFRMLGDLLDRIAYISLGILTADVFRFISRSLVDVAKSAFEAAANFQLLHLRLQGLVARDVIQGLDEAQLATANFGQILADSVGPAKDLFNWVRQIAVTTPFTVETLSNAFSLAKAYNLDTETAKKLVLATGNFVAGMGLEDTVISRVIENMGQMIQQGKITGTELRDLARGAYVPTTEVLTLMAQKAGVTTEAMRDMAKAGKASVADFIDAFIIVANRDFPQAMERMAATFPGLISNVTDFVQAVLGFSVLGPAVDSLTAKFGKLFIDVLGDPRVLESADKLGAFLKDMVKDLFPNLTAKSIVDKVVDGVNTLIGLIGALATGNWKAILVGLGVPGWVMDSINNLTDAFANFKTFWDQNGDALIKILDRVLDTLGLKDFNPVMTFDAATGGIKKFSQWVVDNGPMIVDSVDKIAKSIEHFATVTLPLLQGKTPTIAVPDVPATPAIPATQVSPVTLNSLDELAKTLNNLYDAGVKIATAFNETVRPAFDSISESIGIFGGSLGTANPLLSIFVGLINALAGLAAGVIGGIAETLSFLASAFQQVAYGIGLFNKGIQDIMSNDMAIRESGIGITEAFAGIQTAINGFITFLAWPLAAIFGFVSTIIAYFQNLSDQLVGHSIIPDMINSMFSIFSAGISALIADSARILQIMTSFTELAHEIDAWMGDLAKLLFSKGQIAVNQIARGMETAMKDVIATIAAIIAEIQASIVPIIIPVKFGSPGSANFTNPNPASSTRIDKLTDVKGGASGAQANTGRPMIVGEQGWEMFVPKAAGSIISHLDSMKILSSLAQVSMGQNMMQPMMNIPSNIANTTNYNVSVNANYAATQSPVGISQDLEAVLAKVSL